MTYTLPAAVDEPKNFLKIWPDWSQTGAKSKIFLQYRCGSWLGGAAGAAGGARRGACARVWLAV